MHPRRIFAQRALSFRALVVEIPVVAFALSFVMFHHDGIGGALLLALWVTSPLLWWTGYALLFGRGTPAHRGAVILIGIPLLLIHVAYQVSILTSSSEDSLAAFGYFLVPFELLFGTMIATAISAVAVARNNRKTERTLRTPSPQL